MHNILVLLSVLVLSSIGHLATDIYLPSMPSLCNYFDTSMNLVQLTFSVYLLSFCLTPLIAGPISDRIGRKRPIIIGIIISMVATLLCAVSNSIYLFIFSRFIQGIGLGMVVCVSRAILPDTFQGKQLAQYYSYLTMLFPVILAIGPPIGGLIQDHSSWQMVFVFMLVYLGILLVTSNKIIAEPSAQSFQKSEIPAKSSNLVNSATDGNNSANSKLSNEIVNQFYIYKDLLSNKIFMLYTACAVFIFMGISAYLTVSPFLFQNVLGLTPTQFGSLSIVSGVVVFCCGFLNARLIHKFKPKKLLYLANSFILMSGFILFCLYQFNAINVVTLLLTLLCFFAALPITFANATTMAIKSIKGHFGAATALMSCLQFLGGGIASMLISFADKNNFSALSGAFLLVGLGYFLVLYFEGRVSRQDAVLKPVDEAL